MSQYEDEYLNLSEFKIINYRDMIQDKKYLITYCDDEFSLYTGYYDGTILTYNNMFIILKNVKDIYNNKKDIVCLKINNSSRALTVYSFNGKKVVAQNNMENRALNEILKKITRDKDFDIGLKIGYTELEMEHLNESGNESDE